MRTKSLVSTVAKTIFLSIALAAAPTASFSGDLAVAATTSASASTGGQLDAVRARGQLACGVGSRVVGFAHATSQGGLRGLEVDLCRAVAAAIFGDVEKAKFVPVNAARQFSVLQSGEVDVLSSMTTPTLTRRMPFEADFVGVHYYDRQGFMVLRDSDIRRVKDLDGRSLCVERGTAAEVDIVDYFLARKLAFKLAVMDTPEDVSTAFLAGRCEVMAAGLSHLYATRLLHAPNPNDYRILAHTAAVASLGPAVRHGDNRLAGLVRWAIYATIEAEELGITSRNVDKMLNSESQAIRRFLGVTPGLGTALGVQDKWAYHVVKQVGNYGESYDRNVGARTALQIPRGLNMLSSQGGMMYAPSIR